MDVASPTIRIGFSVDVARVAVSAKGGVALTFGDRTTTVSAATFAIADASLNDGPRYRVQIASVSDRSQAEAIAKRVAAETGHAGDSIWNDSTRTFQVKAGKFPAREDAAAFARQLSSNGFPGAFVSTDGASGAPTGLVKMLETGGTGSIAVIRPMNAAEFVAIDGNPVRGVVEIRAGTSGVTAVNIVNIEDYLRGVVPNELSPLQFPQIEALKAQAVAARTYALKNMGQYKERGYDICATPACQVYKGQATEHPVTDQAVEDTRGVVAMYGGEPINALFTSTCGGHTEDGFNIFPTQTQSYLKGVACEAETQRVAIARASSPLAELGEGQTLNRDVALMLAFDVVGENAEDAAWLKASLANEEAVSYPARLLRAVNRRGCESAVPGTDLARRGAFFAHVARTFCFKERGDRLLSSSEATFLQRAEDASGFANAEEARAAAILVQEDIVTPSSSGRLDPSGRITRSQAIGILARIALKVAPVFSERVEFAGGTEGTLRFRRGERVDTLRTSDRVRLFRELSGVPIATSELALTQGDRVRLIQDSDARVVFLSAEQSRLGPSADRTSRFYRWEESLTPEALVKSMRRYGDPGEVRDLEVLRTGVSGRVIELRVVGSARDITLKGLDIRFALGVRENLFVIDREVDSAGNVKRFVITGKGWGHGVGLCQVGAFGMAQAGATYDQIIKHYYSGVELRSVPF